MAKKVFTFTISQSDFVDTLQNRNLVLSDYAQQEAILVSIFSQFPHFNHSPVLTRITLLNMFYSTAIMDIVSVANHIVNTNNVQSRLSNGDVGVVSDIAKVQHGNKVRRHISFASKFSSFQNPSAFPILDSFVLDVFCELRRLGFFVLNSKFSREALHSNYVLYKAVYDEFIKLSGISNIVYNGQTPDYKEVDNYLWASRKIKSLSSSDPRALNNAVAYNQIVKNAINSIIP